VVVSRYDMLKFVGSISRTNLRQTDLDDILQLLKKDLPWEQLVRTAETEGVAGLLYHHLNNLGCLDLLPEAALHYLEAIYQRTTRNTLAIVSKIHQIAAVFRQARIPVIALQGLSVVLLYKHPGLRSMADADLMVKAHHKAAVRGLLIEAGYRPVPLYPDLLAKDGFLIDIHVHLLNLDRIRSRRYIFPEDLSPMWDNAVVLFKKQDGLLGLDPYDNYIALSAHALKHSYSRLIWLADLHESLLALTGKPIAWAELAERARFWKQEKVVLYSLILIERIFGLDVPLQVKLELGIEQLTILEKRLLNMKIRGLSSSELCLVLWLCNIKGAVNKLKFILETIFPRKEIMAQISDRISGRVTVADYAKRTAGAIRLLDKNLRIALWFFTSTQGRQ
jgi:hypothetical protein